MPGLYADIGVLIAEDTPQMAEAISQLVESCQGCLVVTCDNGDEALELLRSQPFDLFITDMIMPGCHGLDLIRGAREAGCQRITLLTDLTNEDAMRFYARFGFTRSRMTPLRLAL